MRIDEHTSFEQIEVGGEQIQGAFRIERGLGDLGYAHVAFVVEQQGAGRVWPLTQVTCLYTSPTSPGRRQPAFQGTGQ